MADDPSEMVELVGAMDFERITECPVCKETPFPPIFQCAMGHTLCKNCKPKLKICPLCKSSLSKNIRNFTLEEMILKCKFACLYENDGCKLKETGELMSAHVKKCQYAPFMCPRKGWHKCSESKLSLSEIANHLLKTHFADVTESPTRIIRKLEYNLLGNNGFFCDITWPPTLIKFDGKHFLAECFTQKGAICWGVFHGTEEESRLYRVNITLQQGGELEQRWTVPVESMRDCADFRNPFRTDKRFLPSLTFQDFKHIAERFDQNCLYRFVTLYEIFRLDKT